MLARRIIPCLDVKDGRVVKGVRFVDLRDAGDPVEAASPTTRRAPTSSCSSTSRRPTRGAATMLDVVRRTAEAVYLPLTVGGGRRAAWTTCARCSGPGADKVSLNTAAVARPELIRGGGRALRQPVHRGRDRRQAAPAGDRGRGWEVFTHGGRRPTGRDAVAWAREAVALGAGEILLTSMDRDGTRDGYDLELTRGGRRGGRRSR